MKTIPLPIIFENNGKYFEDKDTLKPKINTIMNMSIFVPNYPEIFRYKI